MVRWIVTQDESCRYTVHLVEGLDPSGAMVNMGGGNWQPHIERRHLVGRLEQIPGRGDGVAAWSAYMARSQEQLPGPFRFELVVGHTSRARAWEMLCDAVRAHWVGVAW